MNIRILIRKGSQDKPLEGLVWYKPTPPFGGGMYGRAYLQIETENGWKDIPVVEGDPL